MLSVKDVSKSYSGHRALTDVSIEVPKQSIFGLLGPNGAGKTSLIRIVNQITAPDSGQIFLDGEPLKARHVEQIGYLPEERGLYRKMKAGEQAIYLAQLKGMSKAEAKRILKDWFEKFQILEWWNKKVEELSKGMAQKIQFITTVMHNPKLLILDEPFSGFDPINTNLVKDELMRLRDEGTTIILSTHNMGSVEEICEEIALINKSKKILGGTVADIRKKYSKDIFRITFTGNMLDFTNALWTNFELIEKDSEDDLNHVCKVKLLGDNTLNNLLQALIPAVEIKGVEELIPTMNEVFIAAVNEKMEEQSHE
ncbi:ABC transporter ATP-binding protein [Halocola ammonii]